MRLGKALMSRKIGRLGHVWPMPKHARSTPSERRSENRTQGSRAVHKPVLPLLYMEVRRGRQIKKETQKFRDICPMATQLGPWGPWGLSHAHAENSLVAASTPRRALKAHVIKTSKPWPSSCQTRQAILLEAC